MALFPFEEIHEVGQWRAGIAGDDFFPALAPPVQKHVYNGKIRNHTSLSRVA